MCHMVNCRERFNHGCVFYAGCHYNCNSLPPLGIWDWFCRNPHVAAGCNICCFLEYVQIEFPVWPIYPCPALCNGTFVQYTRLILCSDGILPFQTPQSQIIDQGHEFLGDRPPKVVGIIMLLLWSCPLWVYTVGLLTFVLSLQRRVLIWLPVAPSSLCASGFLSETMDLWSAVLGKLHTNPKGMHMSLRSTLSPSWEGFYHSIWSTGYPTTSAPP